MQKTAIIEKLVISKILTLLINIILDRKKLDIRVKKMQFYTISKQKIDNYRYKKTLYFLKQKIILKVGIKKQKIEINIY